MYRALNPLHKHGQVIPAGSITRLEWVDEAGIQALIHVGAVAPDCRLLSDFPAWKTRSQRLAEIGINTVFDLFVASEDAIATHLKVGVNVVQRWKTIILEEAPPETGR